MHLTICNDKFKCVLTFNYYISQLLIDCVCKKNPVKLIISCGLSKQKIPVFTDNLENNEYYKSPDITEKQPSATSAV